MPYVITTTTPEDYHGPRGVEKRYGACTRRAVATLDEVRETIREFAMQYDVTEFGDSLEEVLDGLMESGGTVGPLPDGTVIEVEHVGWGTLVDYAGLAGTDESGPLSDPVRIIDAYNAAQS